MISVHTCYFLNMLQAGLVKQYQYRPGVLWSRELLNELNRVWAIPEYNRSHLYRCRYSRNRYCSRHISSIHFLGIVLTLGGCRPSNCRWRRNRRFPRICSDWTSRSRSTTKPDPFNFVFIFKCIQQSLKTVEFLPLPTLVLCYNEPSPFNSSLIFTPSFS